MVIEFDSGFMIRALIAAVLPGVCTVCPCNAGGRQGGRSRAGHACGAAAVGPCRGSEPHRQPCGHRDAADVSSRHCQQGACRWLRTMCIPMRHLRLGVHVQNIRQQTACVRAECASPAAGPCAQCPVTSSIDGAWSAAVSARRCTQAQLPGPLHDSWQCKDAAHVSASFGSQGDQSQHCDEECRSFVPFIMSTLHMVPCHCLF